MGRQGHQQENYARYLLSTIHENFDNIRKLLGSPADLVTRKVTIGMYGPACGLVYMQELVDMQFLNQSIIQTLQEAKLTLSPQQSPNEMLLTLRDSLLPIGNIHNSFTLDDAALKLLEGNCLLFLDGTRQVISLGIKGGKERSIDEPPSEKVIRGPRDGFIENVAVNLSLLRRKLADPNLHFRMLKVGERSRNKVVICYLAGVAQPALINEIERRISTMSVDNVPESGSVEQWIEDSFLSPFPQYQITERPDSAIAGIVAGRAAILIEGTPFALIAPATIADFFRSQEDEYERWTVSSFFRILRFFAILITVFLPGLYIALIEYNHGLIPSKLAFSIAGTREGVPFHAVVEAFMMEFTMEILREARVRLPKPVGQTVGIVGGLVIGEAAVQAGIVSPIMVIVVALTAIASFTLPAYNFIAALRLIRFGVMAAAAVLGLFGIMMVFIMICIHITNLEVYGIPYSAPLSSATAADWKSTILRLPSAMLRRRPQIFEPMDPLRSQPRKGNNS